MEITTAMLCESASIRENLLNIRGGNVHSVERASYPAPLGLTLALVAELEEREPVPLDILLVDEQGDIVNKATTTFGVNPDTPDGRVAVPLVFPLGEMSVPAPGTYGVMVETAGEVLATLAFLAG